MQVLSCPFSTLLPTKWRHRIMRRAQKWVHLHTWLKKMKTVSFNNTLGGSRHSWLRCHAPNIGDRRRARLYAGWTDEAVVSVSKTGQKKDQNKGEGRGGCWPSSSICVLIMNENLFLVERLVSWSPFVTSVSTLREGCAWLWAGNHDIAPKLEQLLKPLHRRRWCSRPLFAFQLGRLLHGSVFVEQLQHLLFVVQHFHHGVSGLRHLVHNQLATLHVTLKTHTHKSFFENVDRSPHTPHRADGQQSNTCSWKCYLYELVDPVKVVIRSCSLLRNKAFLKGGQSTVHVMLQTRLTNANEDFC